MSGLIWIQDVGHSDGFPEMLILKKISRRQKSMQNYPVGRDFSAKSNNKHLLIRLYLCTILVNKDKYYQAYTNSVCVTFDLPL